MTTPNTREWEEPLMHIMGSYIMTAELGHLAKDQLKHKQELRAYYAELVDFIHQELQKARHDWLREEIVKLEGIKSEIPKIIREPFELAESVGKKMFIDELIQRHRTELNQYENTK